MSMGFPRQEYWNGLLFPSSGDLPDPGMEPESPALAGGFLTSHQGSPCSMTFKLYLLKRHFPCSLGNLIPCSTFLWPQVDCSPQVCISFFSITFLFSIVFSFFLGGVINFDPFITSQLQVTSHQLTYSTAMVLVSVTCLFLLTCFLFNKTSRMGEKKVLFKHEILKLLT